MRLTITKTLTVGCILFVLFCAFALAPQQVRAANTLIATIPVGGRPFGLAITPNGAYVYVANQLDGSVSVISNSHEYGDGYNNRDKRSQLGGDNA